MRRDWNVGTKWTADPHEANDVPETEGRHGKKLQGRENACKINQKEQCRAKWERMTSQM